MLNIIYIYSIYFYVLLPYLTTLNILSTIFYLLYIFFKPNFLSHVIVGKKKVKKKVPCGYVSDFIYYWYVDLLIISKRKSTIQKATLLLPVTLLINVFREYLSNCNFCICRVSVVVAFLLVYN